jgi:hypothetical protein
MRSSFRTYRGFHSPAVHSATVSSAPRLRSWRVPLSPAADKSLSAALEIGERMTDGHFLLFHYSPSPSPHLIPTMEKTRGFHRLSPFSTRAWWRLSKRNPPEGEGGDTWLQLWGKLLLARTFHMKRPRSRPPCPALMTILKTHGTVIIDIGTVRQFSEDKSTLSIVALGQRLSCKHSAIRGGCRAATMNANYCPRMVPISVFIGRCSEPQSCARTRRFRDRDWG